MTSETTLSAASYGHASEDVPEEDFYDGRLGAAGLQHAPGLTTLARRSATPAVDLSPHTDFVDRHGPLPADTAIESASSATAAQSDRLEARDSESFAAFSRRYVVTQMVLDGLVGILAVAFVLQLPNAQFNEIKSVVLVLGAGIGWPIAVAISHGYERGKIGVGGDEARSVLHAMILGIAAGAVPSAVTDRPGVVALCVMAVPMAGIVSLIVRISARKYLHYQQRTGRNVRRVIVVGSTYTVADLTEVLTREPNCGMQVVGVCVPQADVARAHAAGLPVIGDLEQVPQVINTYKADAVAVAGGDPTRHNYLRELSWALEGSSVEILVHPGLVEVAGPRMHIRPHVGLPLLHVEQPHFTGWRRFAKRATDIVLTSVGLVLVSPIMIAIALAIKLSDGGPVIFRQSRVGHDGGNFTMFKFRSMRVDAEQRLAELKALHPDMGTLFKLEDDPRITRVGRFLRRYSLDELPQLFNVFGGSMSLVGPRPPLQSEVDSYEDHARRRLLVTPGLTGLWQVSGRSLLSWEETVRLDLRYVENWTLTLDLLIMWRTLFAVIAKRGAF
jgi:exopolysaccharide biosynthesis polyprenyl glycosylphosphotransferase